MKLIPARSAHLREIRRIYNEAFPLSERRPFWINERLVRAGKLELLTNEGAQPVCMACVARWKDLALVDYFAVDSRARGGGYGTAALRAIAQRYAGMRLFLEIEAPPADAAPNDIRRRRKAFYLRCGYVDTGILLDVFGVPMELLCFRCSVSFEEYHELYHGVFGARTAHYIRLAPQP